MWKEWRIFKGNSKKERFREHDRYNHSTQLSLSSVVKKSKELVVKEKKSAAESIPRPVVPLVDVVSLCATQEVAMIKVDSIIHSCLSELELSCSFVVYRNLGLACRLE